MKLVWPTQISFVRRSKAYSEIALGSEPRISFYTMVVLSTCIAAFGLLSNSTAVVIGAMLVAPLMTPILGITLSLTSGDRQLFSHALVAETIGIILSVALGFMVGSMVPDIELGSEVLSRTTPTVFDIIVAVAAGLAGAYSMVDDRLNAALPGVAIATSLVPPLTACGLCLSQGSYDLAGNAFLLFFANFLGIQMAGGLIFVVFGISGTSPSLKWRMPDTGVISAGLLFKRFALSIVLFVAVAAFMTQTLYAMLSERRFHRAIESALKDELRTRIGAHLVEMHYVPKKDGIRVVAVVRTPQELLPLDVKEIQKHIDSLGGPQLRLIVRSVRTEDVDADGPVFITATERLNHEKEDAQAKVLSSINLLFEEKLAAVPGARIVNVRRTDDGKTVIATVRSPSPIEPGQVKNFQDALRTQINPDLRLIVSSILTREADAEHFLYESPSKTKTAVPTPLSGKALEYRKRLENSLMNQIEKIKTGANIVDLRYAQSGGQVHVLAMIRTPQDFTPEQVRGLQQGLQADVDPRVRLVVRSVVGTDSSADGYLPSLNENLFTQNK